MPIRPPGNQPVVKMDPDDLGVFEPAKAQMTEHTGWATVGGCHELRDEPEKPLPGDLSDRA